MQDQSETVNHWNLKVQKRKSHKKLNSSAKLRWRLSDLIPQRAESRLVIKLLLYMKQQDSNWSGQSLDHWVLPHTAATGVTTVAKSPERNMCSIFEHFFACHCESFQTHVVSTNKSEDNSRDSIHFVIFLSIWLRGRIWLSLQVKRIVDQESRECRRCSKIGIELHTFQIPEIKKGISGGFFTDSFDCMSVLTTEEI